jgi:hypothetical protein
MTPVAARNHEATRRLAVTLLVFGAVGLVIALDWLHRGDPSEQFTRRRWISWR